MSPAPSALPSVVRVRPDIAVRPKPVTTVPHRRRGHVLALTIALVAVGAGVHIGVVRHLSPLQAPFLLPWPVIALGYFGAQVLQVRVQARRHLLILDLVEVPLIIALFFAAPGSVIAAAVLGTTVGQYRSGTTDRLKLQFNSATTYLQTVTALLVFHSILGSANPISGVGRGAAIVAVLAASALTILLVPCAIAVSGGRVGRDTILEFAITAPGSAMINISLGLIAVTVLWLQPAAFWLLLVLAAVLVAVHHGYDALRRRHEAVNGLHAITRGINAAVEPQVLVEALLNGARKLLGAEVASLIIDGGEAVTQVDDDAPVEVSLDAQSVLRLLGEHSGRVITADAADPLQRQLLSESGLPDAVISAITVDGRRLGALLVGRRAPTDRAFSRDDLRLLETLASHGGVALVNSRLVEQLRRQAAEREYEALHDGLTGLPNRTMFKRLLTEALERGGNGAAGHHAVMLMDLDGFKEVNDTLGHQCGDVLLRQIADRLHAALDGIAEIARLGGDEFAVLVPRSGGELRAIAAARHLLDVLNEPFVIDSSTLHITASIGIALAPAHGDEAVTLMRRADVAMYAAKAEYSQVEVYRAANDPYSQQRLALVGELRAALDAGDLTVAYQPKADLRTGRVVGVEALARWHHAERGFIPPDQFINVAERTGLIAPLTTHILRSTLEQCRTWRLQGLDLNVAVNLSLRSLSPDLPDQVARLLEETGVPASSLTLEITESSIMTDPGRTARVLAELAEMGVTLSIDDFGTGYSSLAYLKRLPVHEIKVDRSFVMNMANDESDAAIVRSTVDLGRNLGLQVVAEGIEDGEVWTALATMGCDFAQGYHLSPPLKADEVMDWCQRQSLPPLPPVRVRRGVLRAVDLGD